MNRGVSAASRGTLRDDPGDALVFHHQRDLSLERPGPRIGILSSPH